MHQWAIAKLWLNSTQHDDASREMDMLKARRKEEWQMSDRHTPLFVCMDFQQIALKLVLFVIGKLILLSFLFLSLSFFFFFSFFFF